MQRPIKIGTRGSPLALYQAHLVQRLLAQKAGLDKAVWDEAFPICVFVTSGDTLKGHLADFGGKGLFTKELESALIGGDIDVAVHSMKDVPTVGQEKLKIGAILEREDPRDAFVSLKVGSMKELPQGAIVGTASLRRRAQLAAIRPDIQFDLLRGNVGTRLGKLAAGICDATFLAYAGLKRLEREDVVTEVISADLMLSAPAQGAIGIEVRVDDPETARTVFELNHRETLLCVTAERAFLRALDGSCRTPIAALAVMDGDRMFFRGQVLSLDGQYQVYRTQDDTIRSEAAAFALGTQVGLDVLDEVGDRNIWDE